MGIGEWFGLGKKTLYYPGCLTKGVLTEQFENYKKIFNKLGIDYVLLMDEVCCGLPVLNAGYKKDVRKLALKNLELFKKNGIKKIITNCPSCYHTFNEVYPKLVREWDIPVEHATVTIYNKVKNRKVRFNEREKVYYHDPCHLGRYSGIYEEPRKVIEILGGEIIEFKKNRKEAFCCGGGGGVRANFPDLAKKIATQKVSRAKGDIVSPCGLCYANMKSVGDNSMEFSDFVLRALKK